MSSSSSSSGAPPAPRGRGRGRSRGQMPTPMAPPGGDMTQVRPPAPPAAAVSETPAGALVEVGKKMQEMIIHSGTMQRPGYGSMGQPVGLLANYFELCVGKGDKNAQVVVQRYEVDITPPRRKIDRDESRLLFWWFIRDNKESLLGENVTTSIAYDDSRCCVSLSKLNLGNGERKFEYMAELPRDNRPECYSIKFLYTGSHLLDLTWSADADHTQRSTTAVQIIDIVCSQYLKCPLIDISNEWYPWARSVFKMPNGNGDRGMDLGGGREMWTGFHSAAKVGENWKPLLNVDINNSAFYKRISVIDFWCDVLNAAERTQKYRAQDIGPAQVMSEQWKALLKRELKGLKIRVNHGKTPRIWRCNDVVELPENIEFDLRQPDGTTVKSTVKEYFESKYGPLRLPNMPCLWVGPRTKKVCIPMEMCELDKHPQKVLKKLTDQQTATMIRACAKPANERKQQIEHLLNRAQVEQDPFMSTFGISMNLNMAQVPGRILNAPGILAGGRPTRPRDGTWKIDQPFLVPVKNIHYHVLSFLRTNDNDLVMDFCRSIVTIGKAMGMSFVQDGPDIADNLQRAEQVGEKLKAINGVKRQSETPMLVFVIMDFRNADIYAEVKRFGEIECGLITQCMLKTNVFKVTKSSPTPQNATGINIVQKINAKLGGVNNSIVVDDNWGKFTKTGFTLFLGIDVTHPGPGDERSPSIGAVVGNVDPEASKWRASIKIQRHRREQLVYPVDAVKERIRDAYEQSTQKPERIIVFRDGVSSGEFTKVLQEEMGGIRKACTSLSPDYQPKITYIVVQKRHHTRFFNANEREAVGKARNIAPGTVVDHVVTHPVEFDFYLCSHFGIQGTSRPTHYCVLHDDSGFTPDQLQMISYQLCHIYQRCPRAVSIPAPAYFADLACTRAKNHHRSVFGHRSSDSATAGSSGETESSEQELIDSVTVTQAIKKNLMYWI